MDCHSRGNQRASSVSPLGTMHFIASKADGTVNEVLPQNDNDWVDRSDYLSPHQRYSIIEGRYGPVVVKSTAVSLNGQDTHTRNKRFQSYVAAKQLRRERVLKNMSRINNNSTVCEQNSYHGLLSTPINPDERAHSTNEEKFLIPCKTKQSVVEHDPSLQDLITSQNNSPTSVTKMQIEDAGFCSDSPECKASPLENTRKFLFIRVESNHNRKGAMKRWSENESPKQLNKLTWWDDESNQNSSNILKSDVSNDRYVHGSLCCCYCNEHSMDDYSLSRRNILDAIEKNSPNLAPMLDKSKITRPTNSLCMCTNKFQ